MALLDQYVSLAECEAAAGRLLPRHVWDYIAGGAGDELTLRRNADAFAELTLRPCFLREHPPVDLTTTVLGSEIDAPILLSPAAMQRDVHRDGEVATARGAAAAGVLTIVPSNNDVAKVAAVAAGAPGPLWLQIYHHDRDTTAAVVARAEQEGYRAIVLTIDVPVQNPKTRDRTNWFLPPYAGVRYALHDETFPEVFGAGFPLSADDVGWLAARTRLPVVVKGVMTGEDAAVAVEHGAQGVFVSNHGGRILDSTKSTIEMLPEVVDAVAGRAEVYLDSGIRRGTDVLKALALGARAVGIGRPWYWGLAIGGPEGVERIVEILAEELEVALALCGHQAARALRPGVVSVPPSWELGARYPRVPPD